MRDYILKTVPKFLTLGQMQPEDVTKLVDFIMTHDNFVCLGEPNKGALLGCLTPMFWQPSVIVAKELGWWVEPEHRGVYSIRLIKQFEEWARDRGATKVLMGYLNAINAEKMDKMYKKLKYNSFEVIVEKEL